MRREIFEAHYDAVYKYIRYLTNDTDLTHDLLQETFYRFYQKNYIEHERTYLLKIARNLVYDHYRRKKIIGFFQLKSEPVAAGELPEAVIERNVENEKLYAALQQIKWNYREVIVLRYIEEYSVKETAMILTCSEVKVKNNTARGLKALRELLGGEDDV
ncbi:DNA-directed RNA polymerase specialized sigma subunit, sigma24 homolog [Solibacillus silvestris StLB046]|uniref:DNA-directed RNA polymerase specialized sigma subunit, sigma24 homolog n=1 Tax=Solibacillus silvestris (strain StLB046) TaxID=1002809 RepID=F2F7Y7_SOLSS|nr:sigma-70 family RNA polymerase sigma factor [Solibacillus silvestris]BAK16080.1 DNA-directed RNA polymerase specialized sigma subunit, sigma24 homolog [Solibacillus silvestris StLB046]